MGVEEGIVDLYKSAAACLKGEARVALRVARLQHGGLRLVVQTDLGVRVRVHARLAHRHLHAQVEEPRVSVPHAVFAEQRIDHLATCCLICNTQCFVFDVGAKASSVHFYCCL